MARDLDVLRAVLGDKRLNFLGKSYGTYIGATYADLFPDCEVGAMPPLGTLYGLSVYVDRSLTGDEEIVFEGGTHSEAIRMRYWDFAALVFPVVAEFNRPPMATC